MRCSTRRTSCVLVDLPPDELLKRLAEGKVYVQDTAARAVDNFFRPNNLVALRELALRRAAERIDSDLLERMQGGGVEGPWAAANASWSASAPTNLPGGRAARQAPGGGDWRPLDGCDRRAPK